MEKKKIAVIASRLKCIDSISVESEKWIDKFAELGYEVHLICGKIGEPTDLAKLEIPELDIKHSEVKGVRNIMFSSRLNKGGKKAAEILLSNLVKRIKPRIKSYIVNNKINILCIENALGKPSNPALTVAMNQLVKELKLPTISRYNDFYWNNSYFTQYGNFSKMFEQYPLIASNIVHVTNTQQAQTELFEKRKIKSRLIPNSIPFRKLRKQDDYNADFRKQLGIKDDQLIFLQPTRIMRKKAIEKSIKLVSEINEATKKKHVLLITGQPAYYEEEYFEELLKKVKRMDVDVVMADDRVFLQRHINKERKFYSIGDAYLNADFILYPSATGFGTPVLEAMAYRKPVLTTKFPTVFGLIEKGASFVLMGTKVTKETVSDVYEILMNKEKMNEMVDFNKQLVKQIFSSENILDKHLVPVLKEFEKPGFIKRVYKKYVSKEKTMYDMLEQKQHRKIVDEKEYVKPANEKGLKKYLKRNKTRDRK